MNSLLTAPQVATLLAVSVATVYRWARTGYLPFVALGRTVRFDPVALEEFVRLCQREYNLST